MLLADGNGPMTEEVELPEVSPSPVALPTTEAATESTALVSPIPTPEPTKGWLNGTTIFWGFVIALLVAVVVYWLKNRKK
jgi:hypothetical protein